MPCLLSCLGKIFQVGHYSQTFQLNFFTPAMLINTIDFLPFYTHFHLDFDWGVTRSPESKTSWLHWPFFVTGLEGSYCGVEAVRIQRPDFNFDWDAWNQGK